MANKKRLTARVVRPYLSTNETIQITGTTRGTLRHYGEQGVIHAIDRTEADYNRWTFAQTVDLRLIQALRGNGVSLGDIIERTASGSAELRDAAYESSVECIRRNRRMLKAIVHHRRQVKRFDSVGARNGYYLRYLPERWMAVLPYAENASGLIDMDDFVEGYLLLMGISEAVGWSQTFSCGTLTSFSGNLASSTTYVFQELASPPMPHITGSRIVDGGCYRSVCPDGSAECKGGSCEECARFGRAPTDKELFAWRTVESTGPTVERTVLAKDIDAPFATGMWLDASKSAAADGVITAPQVPAPAPGGMRTENKPPDYPTILPRLMPQNIRLPLSTTACVLPAGMYLCHQNSFDERDTVLQRTLGILPLMKTRLIDEALELEMSERARDDRARWESEKQQKRFPGPFTEPFAAPRDFGDPKLFGFVLDVPERDLDKLTLLSNAALAPEDGFVVAHADVPTAKPTSSFIQELQVLVDATDLLGGSPC